MEDEEYQRRISAARVNKMDAALKKMLERITQSLSPADFKEYFSDSGILYDGTNESVFERLCKRYTDTLISNTLEEYEAIKKEFKVDDAISRAVHYTSLTETEKHQAEKKATSENNMEANQKSEQIPDSEIDRMIDIAGRITLQTKIQKMKEAALLSDSLIANNESQIRRREEEIIDLLKQIDTSAASINNVFTGGYSERLLAQLSHSLDRRQRKVASIANTFENGGKIKNEIDQ